MGVLRVLFPFFGLSLGGLRLVYSSPPLAILLEMTILTPKYSVVGQAVARIFASKGYKVAVASRSLKEADSTANQLNITSDFSNPDDIIHAFTRVKKELGTPSVVVYNGRSQY